MRSMMHKKRISTLSHADISQIREVADSVNADTLVFLLKCLRHFCRAHLK